MTGYPSRPRQNNEARTGRRSTRLRQLATDRGTASQRSSRMTDSHRSTPNNRQFMFIDQDVDRGTLGEAIRVHVMRESHRARRQLRGLLQQTDSHDRMTMLPAMTPSLRRQPELSRESSQDDSAEQSPSRAGEGPLRQSQPVTIDTTMLKQLAQERLLTILAVTSAGNAGVIPGYRILTDLPDNIIELCDDDTAALNALLALIAFVQSSVSLLQAAQYESSALETLRSRLADTASADHSDETITTVLLLSRLERSRSNEETAGFHEAALSRMIDGRSGIAGLAATNEALASMLRSYQFGSPG